MTQFLLLTLVSALMIISPGPDFAVVVKNCLSYGRVAGLYSALGIAVANLCHVSINLLGIGVIIVQSVLAFTIMKVLGAAYLIYIGVKSLRAKSFLNKIKDQWLKKDQSIPLDEPQTDEPQKMIEADSDLKKAAFISHPGKKGFYSGWLCSLLNPKACLFFLSFFSVILSPDTPLSNQIFYGLWISFMALTWFILVAIFFTNPAIAKKLESTKHWLERFTGGVLVLLGLKLITSEVSQ